MKRIQVITAITFFMIGLIIGLLVASWYSHTGDWSEKGNEIRITDFVADMSWFNPVGVTMDFIFNVTIENGSNENITGAQVTVYRLDEQNSSIAGYYPLVDVGTIEPSEIRIVRLDFFFGLERYSEYKASNYLAILSANGTTVLDERKLL
ncbi:hypothetical protein JXA31_08185 [Candidatus Bathyarchaeota archaeon]|nr:hypothetical protein [Candidatus Bathyarchaeota archaeon]